MRSDVRVVGAVEHFNLGDCCAGGVLSVCSVCCNQQTWILCYVKAGRVYHVVAWREKRDVYSVRFPCWWSLFHLLCVLQLDPLLREGWQTLSCCCVESRNSACGVFGWCEERNGVYVSAKTRCVKGCSEPAWEDAARPACRQTLYCWCCHTNRVKRKTLYSAYCWSTWRGRPSIMHVTEAIAVVQ